MTSVMTSFLFVSIVAVPHHAVLVLTNISRHLAAHCHGARELRNLQLATFAARTAVLLVWVGFGFLVVMTLLLMKECYETGAYAVHHWKKHTREAKVNTLKVMPPIPDNENLGQVSAGQAEPTKALEQPPDPSVDMIIEAALPPPATLEIQMTPSSYVVPPTFVVSDFDDKTHDEADQVDQIDHDSASNSKSNESIDVLVQTSPKRLRRPNSMTAGLSPIYEVDAELSSTSMPVNLEQEKQVQIEIPVETTLTETVVEERIGKTEILANTDEINLVDAHNSTQPPVVPGEPVTQISGIDTNLSHELSPANLSDSKTTQHSRPFSSRFGISQRRSAPTPLSTQKVVDLACPMQETTDEQSGSDSETHEPKTEVDQLTHRSSISSLRVKTKDSWRKFKGAFARHSKEDINDSSKFSPSDDQVNIQKATGMKLLGSRKEGRDSGVWVTRKAVDW